MRLGIIGLGTIGSSLAEKVLADADLELGFVFDSDSSKLEKFDNEIKMKSLDELEKFKVDLVVEAAGHDAVREYAVKVLEKSSFLIMSVGALYDEKLREEIKGACIKHNTKFYIAPGAIIGLDGISTAKEQLEKVQIVTRKNPKGFGREDKEEKVLFDGSARQGCKEFPKNINVAATLSLNGIGFDKTNAKIISDPDATANSHTIIAEGDFGKFTINVEAKPSKNPKTSGLAAISAFWMVKQIANGINLY